METYVPALIGLLGVLVGGILTTVKDYWLSARKETKARTYTCVRLVSILERFAESCITVVDDSGERDDRDCLAPTVKSPRFDPSRLDINWELLPPMLLYRVHEIPNQIQSSEEAIWIEYEHGSGPPDYEEFFESRQLEYLKIALDAYDLATCLRLNGDLPYRDRSVWDPIRYLHGRKQELEASIKRRKAAFARPE